MIEGVCNSRTQSLFPAFAFLNHLWSSITPPPPSLPLTDCRLNTGLGRVIIVSYLLFVCDDKRVCAGFSANSEHMEQISGVMVAPIAYDFIHCCKHDIRPLFFHLGAVFSYVCIFISKRDPMKHKYLAGVHFGSIQIKPM